MAWCAERSLGWPVREPQGRIRLRLALVLRRLHYPSRAAVKINLVRASQCVRVIASARKTSRFPGKGGSRH